MIQYRLKNDYFFSQRKSQAHCLVAQANAQPKPAKELACPNAQTDKNKARNANNVYTK
ncbi:MAG: hypothetical protein KKG99_13555 [Bacteroidetes bacterium]|nr:hypothetical protein [Bacteroidota bacterium]